MNHDFQVAKQITEGGKFEYFTGIRGFQNIMKMEDVNSPTGRAKIVGFRQSYMTENG